MKINYKLLLCLSVVVFSVQPVEAARWRPFKKVKKAAKKVGSAVVDTSKTVVKGTTSAAKNVVESKPVTSFVDFNKRIAEEAAAAAKKAKEDAAAAAKKAAAEAAAAAKKAKEEAAAAAKRAAQAAAAAAKKAKEEAAAAAKKLAETKAAQALAEAAKKAADEAKMVLKKTTCLAGVVAAPVVGVAQKLVGKVVKIDEITIEGTLKGLTFSVNAKGSIVGKSFNIKPTLSKESFTKEGLQKAFYDPLAKLF